MMWIVSWKNMGGDSWLGPALGISLWTLCALPVVAGPLDEWQQAKNLDTCAAYEAYAAKYPDNQISTMARNRAEQLCKPVAPPPPPLVATPEPDPSPPPPSPSPAPLPATGPTEIPTPSPPPPSSSDGRAAVLARVEAYYAALDRADARAAAQMWFEPPRAIRFVPNNEYCKLHRRDLTYFGGYRADVAVDVTCKSRGEASRSWEVNLTLERVGSQWKIRSLKPR